MRWGRLLVRLLGFGVLLSFLWRSRASLEDVLAALMAIAPEPLMLALGFYLAGLGFMALRVAALLGAAGHRVGLRSLARDVFKGAALNVVLPSGAGEIYRVQRLREQGLDLAESGSAVLIDRLVGIGVSASAGLLGCIVMGADWLGSGQVLALLAALAVLAAVTLGLCVRRRAESWWVRLRDYLPMPRTLALLVALSVAMLLSWVASVSALARALSLGVGFEVLVFAAPLVALASLLPISIGGIGVREAGYALLLASHGITTSDAVALGLLQYALALFVAAVGGSMLVIERLRGVRVADARGSDDRTLDAQDDLPAADEGPEHLAFVRHAIAEQEGFEPTGRLQEMSEKGSQGAAREVGLDDRRSAV